MWIIITITNCGDKTIFWHCFICPVQLNYALVIHMSFMHSWVVIWYETNQNDSQVQLLEQWKQNYCIRLLEKMLCLWNSVYSSISNRRDFFFNESIGHVSISEIDLVHDRYLFEYHCQFYLIESQRNCLNEK